MSAVRCAYGAPAPNSTASNNADTPSWGKRRMVTSFRRMPDAGAPAPGEIAPNAARLEIGLHAQPEQPATQNRGGTTLCRVLVRLGQHVVRVEHVEQVNLRLDLPRAQRDRQAGGEIQIVHAP